MEFLKSVIFIESFLYAGYNVIDETDLGEESVIISAGGVLCRNFW